MAETLLGAAQTAYESWQAAPAAERAVEQAALDAAIIDLYGAWGECACLGAVLKNHGYSSAPGVMQPHQWSCLGAVGDNPTEVCVHGTSAQLATDLREDLPCAEQPLQAVWWRRTTPSFST